MEHNIEGPNQKSGASPGFPVSVRLAGVIWIMVGGFLLFTASTMLWQKLHPSSTEFSTDKTIATKLVIEGILMAALISVGISVALGKDLPISRIGALSIISGCFGLCSSVVVFSIIADAGFYDYSLWRISIINAGLVLAGLLARGGGVKG
jgi:hypothetical protein